MVKQHVPEFFEYDPIGAQERASGQQVEVAPYALQPDENGLPVPEAIGPLIREVADEVLGGMGIRGDESLIRTCDLVTRAVLAQMFSRKGLEVLYGPYPHHTRLEVQLGETAEVTRQELGEQ